MTIMTDKDKKSQPPDSSASDAALWRHVTKDITPLKGKETFANTGKKPTSRTAKSQNHEQPHRSEQNKAKSNEIDHRTAKRLRQGKINIDVRIDLHGMTQIQAYDALKSLIPNAHAQAKRCILVITGKGTPRSAKEEQKPGILKQKLPQWLSEPHLSHYILRIEPAHHTHGGQGAFYVLLRRHRKTN